MNIRFRHQWGATVPLRTKDDKVTMMTLPAKGLYIHHTVTNPTDDPDKDIRRVEAIGQERFGYYSYSFTSHPNHEDIYEGAGLSIGAHTHRQNSDHFGLSFVGNHDRRILHRHQWDQTQWLYWHLIDEGAMVKNAFVKPHQSVVQTGCPGKLIMGNWERFERFIKTRPKDESMGIGLNSDDERRAWVVDIYWRYLFRAPSKDDLNFWVWITATEGQFKTIHSISTSPEAERKREENAR